MLARKWKRWKRKLHNARERAYAALDSRRVARKGGRVLFVDAGSNVGQGFRWFAKRYDDPETVFHLFEPNPHCRPALETVQAEAGRNMHLYPQAVGAAEGTLNFYGLAESEGGALSQGGSIVRDHNSGFYTANDETAITVPVIDFPAYLNEQRQHFDTIVVKMDIEGAELDVLDAVLERGALDAIDTLYVEFHARYQSEPARSKTRAREQRLVQRLRQAGLKRLRIWH